MDLWTLPLEDRGDFGNIVARLLPEANLTLSGSLRVRGSWPGEQGAYLDGFRLDRLARVPLAAVADVDVATAALGAGLANVPGAALALSTRAPQGQFHWAFEAAREPETEPGPPWSSPVHRSANAVDGAVSGPLPIRHLRFLLGFHAEQASLLGDPTPLGTRSVRSMNGTSAGLLKLSLAPHRSHRIDLLAMVDRSQAEHSAGRLFLDFNAQPVYDGAGLFVGARWSGDLMHGLSASSQVSFQRSFWEESSVLCRKDPSACRHAPAILSVEPVRLILSNWPEHAVRIERSLDVATTVTWAQDIRRGLGHRARLTSRLRWGRSFEGRSAPDDGYVLLQGPRIEARTDFFTSDPRSGVERRGWSLFPGRATSTLHAVEDEVRLWDRLWVTPGLALLTSQARSAVVTLNDTALAPQFQGRWQVTRSGTTTVRLSSEARFADQLGASARLAAGTPFFRTCRQDPVTGQFDRDCYVGGGPREAIRPTHCPGQSRGPDGNCLGKTRLPRTREHALALVQTVAFAHLQAELVHRKTDRLAGLTEERGGSFLGSSAIEGVSHSPRPLFAEAMTDPTYSRRYLGVTLSAAGHKGPLDVALAYSQASLRDDRGQDASADRRHVVRALARYQLAHLASVTVLYRGDSGLPYAHYFLSDQRVWERKAPVGRSPGSNLNDPSDDRELRLPWIQQVNFQARLSLRRLIPVRLSLFLDVFNLFNSAKVTAIHEREGASFGVDTASQERRWARLGLSYQH